MVARPAAPHAITADAVEFIRFCYARRRVGWPELYDEMCAVASRGLFRGWGQEELAEAGVKFGLFEMPSLAARVCEIVAEDRARARRPPSPDASTGRLPDQARMRRLAISPSIWRSAST